MAKKNVRVHKVIVTNGMRLQAKYGATGYQQVQKALKALIAADAKRGLTTRVVELDSAADMTPLAAPVVTTYTNEQQNKNAIDGVYAGLNEPDYLVLLGTHDVIPHQHLTNPLADGDPDVPSDLPYACASGHSTAIGKFRGPTRVVGRLPDVVNAKTPAELMKLLVTATKWASSPRANYSSLLAITTEVWSQSTALSAQNISGSNAVFDVPPNGPTWTATQLKRRMHFINCHGAPADTQFYGEDAKKQTPVALRAAQVGKTALKGAVVSAECCYGAEQFDPTINGQGICNAYLSKGAYGFFGSSNIAYGPAVGNTDADLICQYFLIELLNGASLGRAALEARQQFVAAAAPLSPTELKTLGQFNLLGDPSIHPVTPPKSSKPKSLSQPKGLLAHTTGFPTDTRDGRRERLSKAGLALSTTAGAAEETKETSMPKEVKTAMQAAAERLQGVAFQSYAVDEPAGATLPKSLFLGAKPPAKTAYHVAIGSLKAKVAPKGPAPAIPWKVVIVAKERDGELDSMRELYSR